MLSRPADWDTTQAATGEGEQLPPGGHICQIVSASAVESKGGKPMLVIELEIAEGSTYDGIYHRKFEARQKNIGQYGNAHAWPCVYRQLTQKNDGSTNPFYKGLMESVEASNPGYVWNFDVGTLKNKRVGFVFGEEEFQTTDGRIVVSVKPMYARSVEAIQKGVDVPERKKLNDKKQAGFNAEASGFTPVDDDELPF